MLFATDNTDLIPLLLPNETVNKIVHLYFEAINDYNRHGLKFAQTCWLTRTDGHNN